MNNKKDFSGALRATSTQQKAVIEDRFSRADSVLLNPVGAAAAAFVAPAEPRMALAPRDCYAAGYARYVLNAD